MPSALTPHVKPTDSQAHPFLGFCFLSELSVTTQGPQATAIFILLKCHPKSHLWGPGPFGNDSVRGARTFGRTLCHVIWLPFRVRWRHTVVVVVVVGDSPIGFFFCHSVLISPLPPPPREQNAFSKSTHWEQEPELTQGTQTVLSKAPRGRCFFSCHGTPFQSGSLLGV